MSQKLLPLFILGRYLHPFEQKGETASLDRVNGLTKLSRCLDILLDIQLTIDDSSYRRNFDLDKKNEIHYHLP